MHNQTDYSLRYPQNYLLILLAFPSTLTHFPRHHANRLQIHPRQQAHTFTTAAKIAKPAASHTNAYICCPMFARILNSGLLSNTP